MVHQMILEAMNGKLHYAPVTNPKRILDLGTGTGVWVCGVGRAPSTSILGLSRG